MSARVRILPLVSGFAFGIALSLSPHQGNAQEHLILDSEVVHKELGLTPEQVEKLREAAAKFIQTERKAIMEVTNGTPFGSLSSQQQSEMRPRIIEAIAQLDDTVRQELSAILNADQMQRLRQLRVQALGPAVILQSSYVPEFQVPADQQEKLAEAVKEFRTKYVEENRDSLSKLNQTWAAATIRDAVTNWLVSQLTEELQQQYRQLAGEPAELPFFKNLR